MAPRNICQCPNPPGGVARCEPHQLAICTVEDGKAVTECVNVLPVAEVRYRSVDRGGPYHRPSPFQRQIQLEKWAYRLVTGVKAVRPGRLSPRQLAILRSGTFRRPKTGAVVTFSLPDVLNKKLGIKMRPEIEGEQRIEL